MDLSRLQTWFIYHKRDLPWRRNPTPYQVWISEVMLQQTQVSVVIPYYLKWMETFPTIEALAKAPLDLVIKTWEGLGYYSRARRLHQAATIIMENFEGNLPDNEEELSIIPGMGPYTRGAILSFAFHQRKAAVDGNVMRVVTRLLNLHENISKPKTVSHLFDLTFDLLDEKEPWVTMEALIELGATICKKKPECTRCPLIAECKAFEENTQCILPIKDQREKAIELHRDVDVIVSRDAILLKKETDVKALMADLWEFPYQEKEEERMPFLEKFFHTPLVKTHEMPLVKHGFTRYKALLYPALFFAKETPEIPGHQWVAFKDLPSLAFSAGHRKILMQVSLIQGVVVNQFENEDDE